MSYICSGDRGGGGVGVEAQSAVADTRSDLTHEHGRLRRLLLSGMTIVKSVTCKTSQAAEQRVQERK